MLKGDCTMKNTTPVLHRKSGRGVSDAPPGEEGERLQPRQMDRCGRKFEDGESPEECVLQETLEETG